MFAIASPSNRGLLRAALASLFVAAVGCGDPDNLIDNLPPYMTPDGSTVVVPDAGGTITPAPEAGSSAGQEAGTQSPRPDAGTGMDATVTQVSDAGDGAVAAPADASSDGSVEMDGSVSDAAPSDGAAGDGSSGDAAISDASTSDGATSDGSTSDAGPRADLGKGNGSDVVTIGDSWMDNTLQLFGTGGGIAPALRSVSRQSYRNYAVQGVELLAGNLFGAAIPTQWDAAVRANRNIKTVIMTAGGNDVIQNASLQESCKNGGPECKAVLEKIGQTLAQLWAKMAAGGVQDIVHIMYAKVAGDGVKEGEANAASLKMLCDNVPAPTRCHIFFTDTYVRTKSDLADGIHPKAAINTNIARGLLEYMTQQGMRR